MKTIYGIIALSIFFYACTSGESKSVTNEKPAEVEVEDNSVVLTEEQIKNGGIVIGTAEQKQLNKVLRLKGAIDVPPTNIVSISAPMGGYLKNMNLLPGMAVKKGAVLARLEDQQYIQLQQDYLVAKSRLQFLEADFTRQKNLNETQAVSDKVFQQTKSEYQSQKAMVKSFEEKLKLIGIDPHRLNDQTIARSIPVLSPINGYVNKVNVNTGKYVTATDVLFEVIDPSDIHLALTVFENDIANLSIGQRVLCYTNNNPEKKYVAKVILINRSVDEERASEVHCHFETEDKQLLPGMFMNAELELNNATSTALPDDAIVRWENKYYVFTAGKGNRFVMEPVEIGESEDGYTAIKTDNLKGKKVVTGNAYTLLMKMKNSGEEE